MNYQPNATQLTNLTGDQQNPLALWLNSSRFVQEMDEEGASELLWEGYATQKDIELLLLNSESAVRSTEATYDAKVYALNVSRPRLLGFGRRKFYEPSLWFRCKKNSALTREVLILESMGEIRSRSWFLGKHADSSSGIQNQTYTFLSWQLEVVDVMVTMLPESRAADK